MTLVIVQHLVGRKNCMRQNIYNMFHLLSMLYGFFMNILEFLNISSGKKRLWQCMCTITIYLFVFMSFGIKKRSNIYGRNNAFIRILMIVSYKFVKYGGAKNCLIEVRFHSKAKRVQRRALGDKISGGDWPREGLSLRRYVSGEQILCRLPAGNH